MFHHHHCRSEREIILRFAVFILFEILLHSEDTTTLASDITQHFHCLGNNQIAIVIDVGEVINRSTAVQATVNVISISFFLGFLSGLV